MKKAVVMSLEREAGLVEAREGAHGPLTRLFPMSPTGVKVSGPLKDDETITLDETKVRVFAVPEHTGVPVKAIAFAHSDVLTNGIALLTAYAKTNQEPFI